MEEVSTEEWVEDWIEQNIQTPGYCQDKGEMSRDAGRLTQDAKSAGISEAELQRVCGGDLERYLMHAQNSFTDSEVRRKAEDDKY